MSFFPKSFFEEKPKQERPRRSRGIPSRKLKKTHKHYCQKCNDLITCSILTCQQPDSIMECYKHRPLFEPASKK